MEEPLRKLLAISLAWALYSTGTLAASGRHSSSHSYSHRSHKSRSETKESKPVQVRSYRRKDGTLVHAYDRRLPGTATDTASHYHPFRRGHLAEGYAAHPTVARDSHGRIKRSKASRGAFTREHPCPSTGKTSGRCSGYIVDHVTPLECGGADSPSNMQWQTTADAKAKDKTERYCR